MATRFEKVILSLEDHFSSDMASAAVATGLLDKRLDHLNRTMVRTAKDSAPLGNPNGPIGKTRVQSVQASREIDRMSGRLKLLAQGVAILGPGLVPIAAIGIPAVAGLASQFGAAALAGGVAVLAFQGVGDALTAVNKAALEPTTENLEAARIAMQKLGPEARLFVAELHGLMPAFAGVRNAAGAGLFPGLTASLDDLEALLPMVERIAFSIGDALGSIAEGGAGSLASSRWSEFLGFLETDVPPILTSLARTVGNLAHGLAELWMAFDPVNDDFSAWMERASASFDKWAQGLSQTEGFQEFVAYLRENGPIVADALGSIAMAVLRIVEAAAPLGGPVLQALAAVADAISAIAGSDAGPTIMATVTALALLSRGMKTFGAISSSAWIQSLTGAEKNANMMSVVASRKQALLRGGAGLAGLAVAATGVADGFGLANTASMALMGSVGGPWGAAIGGAIGLMMDLGSGSSSAAADVDALTATLNQQTGAVTANSREWAANKLFDSGALEAAQELGLDLETVTSAALGNTDALALVNAEIERYQNFQESGGAGKLDPLTGEVSRFDEGGERAEELERMADAAGVLDDGLNGTNGTLAEAQLKIAAVGDALAGVKGDYDAAGSSAADFARQVENLNNTLEQRASMRDYQASLDDFKNSLKGKNLNKLIGPGGKIRIGLEGGREVQAALDNIANTAFKVAKGLTGMDRRRYLQQAREDFIASARLLGLNGVKAQELADDLGLVDRTRVNPKVNVTGLDPALSRLQALNAQLTAANRDVTASVTTTFITNRPDGPNQFGGRAEGGWTGPGRKYDERGTVHADEFVFSKAATHGNVEFLDSLHRQMRGYAGGGLVGGGGDRTFNVKQPSLKGLSIVGRLDINTGQIRGVIVDVVEDAEDMAGARARASYGGITDAD